MRYTQATKAENPIQYPYRKSFDGADIDIEIKAKVIYESDKDNIINEYIVFCKVFNEQVKEHGMTKHEAFCQVI